jgi:hypothetical protein
MGAIVWWWSFITPICVWVLFLRCCECFLLASVLVSSFQLLAPLRGRFSPQQGVAQDVADHSVHDGGWAASRARFVVVMLDSAVAATWFARQYFLSLIPLRILFHIKQQNHINRNLPAGQRVCSYSSQFSCHCLACYCYTTTGDTCFPKCQMHSWKAQKHLGKPSPSATLGEEPPGMPLTGKVFPECQKSYTPGSLSRVSS